jgi:hypothetical protein
MELVRAMPLAAQIPSDDFVIEVESPYLSGVFDVLCAHDPEAIQLQMFPDVGGKVLDLTIRQNAIDASMSGDSYQATAPFDAAEPHLALLLAVILTELQSPIVAERIIGERHGSDGLLEVKLAPILRGGRVIAEVRQTGEIRCYRIRFGALEFSLAADGTFVGRGFMGRICP